MLWVSCELLEDGDVDCWQAQRGSFIVGKTETHDFHIYLLRFLSIFVTYLKDLH